MGGRFGGRLHEWRDCMSGGIGWMGEVWGT